MSANPRERRPRGRHDPGMGVAAQFTFRRQPGLES